MAFTTTAGQLVTTDYPLAALQSLAMFGFVLSRFGDERSPPRKVGIIVMWLGFSLGFLNKGPPALTTLVPVMVLSLIFPNPRRSDWKVHLVGILLLAALAFPWYFDVTQRHEGLMDYFLRDEVVERVATDRFKRNGEWYGWLKVYGPTLLLGALPWTLSFLGWIRSTPGILKAYRARQGENVASHEDILLIAWIAIPLLIFCLSRSRLPLYVLPLFTPIAIAIAFTRLRMGLSMPRKHLMFLWITSLLAVRLLAANFPTHKDASAWAAEIRSRATMPVTEIVFIEDMARYGIHLHMEAQIEKAARDIEIATRFNPVFDDLLENEVKESKSDPGTVFVVKQELWKDVSSVVESVGFEPIALGGPFQDRVIFRVKPAVAAH
jgi:4-amino-4-deoxy-L-arabinose transferase-like glycosyltransferase